LVIVKPYNFVEQLPDVVIVSSLYATAALTRGLDDATGMEVVMQMRRVLPQTKRTNALTTPVNTDVYNLYALVLQAK
jgi:hypothetical protein